MNASASPVAIDAHQRKTIIVDIEVYKNVTLVCMKQIETGKILIMENSDRSTIDLDRLRNILLTHTAVGFNSMGYDAPLLWMIIAGAGPAKVKAASDRIIKGRIRWWDVEEQIGVHIPFRFKQNHIDLIEPQPNPFASLKVLHGRMHGLTLQDLPFDPDRVLTFDEIDLLREYVVNDIVATELLYVALKEELHLREIVGNDLGIDLRSKSDSQMGLAIIKKRVESVLGRRIERQKVQAGWTFQYAPPDYLQFETPFLRDLLTRISEHQFIVRDDGKVDLPKWLSDAEIIIGSTQYSMGIGGLHSMESNRAIKSDDDNVLCDVDAGSYYPAIILALGLYPMATGRSFLHAYRDIRDDRMQAKRKKDKVRDKGFKIALNGGGFGSLGSPYSFTYAPHLLIATTLTGQLALLLLIERAERLGIKVVSANTDGIVFYCPRDKWGGVALDDGGNRTVRLNPCALNDVLEQWEKDTEFNLEATEYKALYNQSVNSYFALKADGGHKRKGPNSNPWNPDKSDFDPRGQLMKNPQMTICSDAALAKIKHGTPVAETIRNCRDIKQFVTVIKAAKGATWEPSPQYKRQHFPEYTAYDGTQLPAHDADVYPGGGSYLGKVVRYYWGVNGAPIYRADPHPTTGNFAKVPKTDGAIECMRLPDEFPDDIDYERYIAEAESILSDLGYYGPKVEPRKPIRITKANREAVLRAWLLAA
ncbi:hypothetical protein [Manganibacter manganicus]|uniref:Uncharacterized protein n=1 Tax=Manganibacter manganicus TaxID=1873176 RepID=A0A1V8RNX8_9HYPH|nr:hypothetical protein [Pseudaminobacter manganicus]OQM74912.1 hypothetical protein BFN67_04670 [Pseudaminobacter manganicus]